MDKLPPFTSYSNETLETSQLSFTGLTEEFLGVFVIKVNVTDELLAFTEYEIEVKVDKPSIFAGVVIQ